MAWRNSFFQSDDERSSDDIEASKSRPGVASTQKSKMREPTSKLTGHQLFYIFGMHGIGAMIISGGINLAIAYAMYRNQPDVRLFALPNSLAGDAVITILLQCLVTWMIELAIVSGDLRSGGVQPIGFIPAPPPAYVTSPVSHRLLSWYTMAEEATSRETSASSSMSEPSLIRRIPRLFGRHAVRALVLFVPAFILLWGPTVGILTAVGTRDGEDWAYPDKWTPQTFKAILGGVLGLLATPLMAGLWLVRAGWAARAAADERVVNAEVRGVRSGAEGMWVER